MPVTPGATGADFDVLLAFSLDEEANKRVQSRTSTIEQELKRIQQEALKAGKAFNTAMQSTEKKADTAQKSVARIGTELAKLSDRAKQSSNQVNQAVDGTIRKYKELEEAAKRVKQQSREISGAAARAGSIFGQGLIAGGALAGGILAEANRYVKEAEAAGRATEATREWTRATENLARARSRVDNALLREALPLLQQAARVANQAAGFVEKHPEIVQAALNVGLVVAGLSAVGLAVSKGVKLVADVRYLAAVATELVAAKLHKQAADEELAAASKSLITNRADDLRRGLGQATPAATGGLATLINSPAGILAMIAAYGIATVKAEQYLERLDQAIVSFGQKANVNSGLISGAVTLLDQLVGVVNPLVPALKNLKEAAARDIPLIEQFFSRITGIQVGGSTGGASATTTLGSSLTNTANGKAVVDAFTKWKEEDARLINEAADKRKQIIADAEKSILDSTSRLNAQRVSINRQADRARADLVRNFAEQSKEDEANRARQRADIIREAGQDILEIEQQNQENIRKLTLDHNQRVDELVAARDALGLAKEQRQFDRERSEAERETNQEIAKRRQGTALRLQQLDADFAVERAQRQAQFQEQLADNEAHRREQLAEAAAAHAEEMKRIREQKNAQLRELQEGLNAERKRKREVFIAEIRDLDASLLGERELRRRYYNTMLRDAEAWLAQYRATLPGGSSSRITGVTGSVGTRDTGGYADRGLYRLAWNGQREFVMSGSTTRAAEQMIGSQLTQDNLVRAMTAARSVRQATYNDNKKLYQTPSKDILALMEQSTERAIERMMGD